MTPASHLISPNVPGCGPSDGRCRPCSSISGGGIFNILPCSSRSDYKSLPKFKVVPWRCVSWGSMSSICYAYPGGGKRNPDFSRSNKQGHFRNSNNRQNEEGEGIDDEESEFIPPSKNGTLLSGSPKYEATATPGPREKEIVELFKKVQAKLRERQAYKEVKEVDDSQGQSNSQGQSKQNETVDILINLLSKQRPQQGKENNISSFSSDFNMIQPKENDPTHENKIQKSFGSKNRGKNLAKELLDLPKQNGPVLADENRKFVGSNNMVKDESEGASFRRSVSNFQRRSPVPQLNYDKPSYSDEEESDDEEEIDSFINLSGKRKEAVLKPKAKPESKQEAEAVGGSLAKLLAMASKKDEIASDDEDGDGDENTDLSEMKISELRAVPKSRDMEGFWRLKKQEPKENDPTHENKIQKSFGSKNRGKNLAKELLDLPKQNGPVLEDENRKFVGSNNMVKDESEGASFRRPVSNFQRKSPVPQLNYDKPSYSDEEESDDEEEIDSFVNINGKRKEAVLKPKAKPESKQEAEAVVGSLAKLLAMASKKDEIAMAVLKPKAKPESKEEAEAVEGSLAKLLAMASKKDEIASDDEDGDDDEKTNLSEMKISELREVAKSRGMKGFSRLKKQELIELLGRGSI